MSRKTATARILTRVLAATAAVTLLGGCVSYYDRHYGGSGVYYGGGYETQRYSYREPLYAPVNPVHYPYWSIDYFYFSQYQHPYSFYVGYHEPLYYPYPGWALGYSHHRHYRHYRGGLAFGYPWHGFGHYYPRFSLGFFAHYGGHRGHYGHYDRKHRIRHVDERLRQLQHPARGNSRRVLAGGSRTDRLAGRGGIPLRSDRSGSNEIRGSARIGRSASRSSLLRARDGSEPTRAVNRGRRADDRLRGAGSRHELQRRRASDAGAAIDRRDARRAASGSTLRSTSRSTSRSSSRSSSRSTPRAEAARHSRESRRAPPRTSAPVRSKQSQRIQPDPGRTRRAVLRGSPRGDSSAPIPRSSSSPAPDRSSHRAPSRAGTAAPTRSRPSPPPRSRASPPSRSRASQPTRSGDAGRRAVLRDRGGRSGRKRR